MNFRFRNIGNDNHVVAVVAPLWAPRVYGGYAESELLYLGEEREAHVYPI